MLDKPLQPGRVIRHDRGRILVATGRAVLEVDIKSPAGNVANGDWVALIGSRLVAVLPRKGALRRKGS